MKVAFDLPVTLVEQAIEGGIDLGRVAKESLLLELFRRRVINHADLRETLGKSLLDTDAMLKDRNVPIGEATREEQIERNQGILRFLKDISKMDVPPDQPSWEEVKAGIARARAEETEP